MSFEELIRPRSVAVVGASEKPNKIGHIILSNLNSFAGEVYPINPHHEEINGKKCFPTVDAIGKQVDIALIAVPAEAVPSVLRSSKNAKNIVIISSGFSEIGNEKLSKEILRIARGNKQRILGPNCVGIQLPNIKFNGTFISELASSGNIAFISQSGGFCGAMLGWAKTEALGFSAFISIGNMIDIDFAELIDYLNKDKNTKAIAIYLEGLKEGRKFLEAARKSKKPIIVYKVGKTEEGKKAAITHTGSLAGSYEVYQGMFRQAKIIEANSTQELFDLIKAVSLIKEKRDLIILSNSGGPLASAADSATKLLPLSESQIKELNNILKWDWSKKNPIDISGNATSETYSKVLKVLGKEKSTILLILVPTTLTNPAEIAKTASKYNNLITCFMSGELVKEGVAILRKNKIANFDTPEQAVNVLKHLS